MPHKIRIAIVGAGETGAPLLEQLLSADFVKVVGIADLKPEAPGMVIARSHGVKTFGDFLELPGTTKTSIYSSTLLEFTKSVTPCVITCRRRTTITPLSCMS
jgi:acetaldehyde dehydrogenase (acetylating)